jgi:hypothetical protein
MKAVHRLTLHSKNGYVANATKITVMSYQRETSLVDRCRQLEGVGEFQPMPDANARCKHCDVVIEPSQAPPATRNEGSTIAFSKLVLAQFQRAGHHFGYGYRSNNRADPPLLDIREQRFKRVAESIAFQHINNGIRVDQNTRAIWHVLRQVQRHSSRCVATCSPELGPH